MTRCWRCSLLALLFIPTWALAQDDKDFTLEGWVRTTEVDKVLALAKEKDRPLVFMLIPRNPSSSQSKQAQVWARDSSLQSRVRVLVYKDNKQSAANRLFSLVDDDASDMPRLFFATSQMQISGYVSPRDARRLRGVGGLASSIDAWCKSVAKDLAKADQLAEQGRYGAAMKIINGVGESDLTYSAQVYHTWTSLPPPSDAKDKPGEPADKPPVKVQPLYFPKLPGEKTAAYQAKAAARLAEARKHHTEGNSSEARRLLAPLAADGADFEEQAEARKLMAQIVADTSRPPEKDESQESAQ